MPPFVEETSAISSELQPEGGDWNWVCFQRALKEYSKVKVFETALQIKGKKKVFQDCSLVSTAAGVIAGEHFQYLGYVPSFMSQICSEISR